jgi:hypothetical protein
MAAPAVSDGWFIVDGQRRVTLPLRCLTGSQGDPRWNIGLIHEPAFSQGPSAEDLRRQVPRRRWVISPLGRWRRRARRRPTWRVEDAAATTDYGSGLCRGDDDGTPCVRVCPDKHTGVRMRRRGLQALLGQQTWNGPEKEA